MTKTKLAYHNCLCTQFSYVQIAANGINIWYYQKNSHIFEHCFLNIMKKMKRDEKIQSQVPIHGPNKLVPAITQRMNLIAY